MANIIFTDTIGIPKEFLPKPADSSIPDWYKQLDSYIGKEKKPSGEGVTTATIKRCMPVFDAITSGYILYTYTDVFVSQKAVINTELIEPKVETVPWYEWPSYGPIQFHPVQQAPTHPRRTTLTNESSYPKWINPWSIKTPPGYSVLFVQPMHRQSLFSILEGVVDTDKYDAPVNFPFTLNDWKFEGLIPAGTPMAQVIPFKRESWEMSMGNEVDQKSQGTTSRLLRTRFFDSYKSQFRQLKEYK